MSAIANTSKYWLEKDKERSRVVEEEGQETIFECAAWENGDRAIVSFAIHQGHQGKFCAEMSGYCFNSPDYDIKMINIDDFPFDKEEYECSDVQLPAHLRTKTIKPFHFLGNMLLEYRDRYRNKLDCIVIPTFAEFKFKTYTDMLRRKGIEFEADYEGMSQIIIKC